MANVLYDSARQLFLQADIDWLVDTIKVVLLKTGGSDYVFNSAHDYLNDVPGGATRVATATLAGKTSTGGVADCTDPTFSAVAAGSTVGAVLFYKDTGSEPTSPLILYVDTATGLPLATNGGDITLVVDNGSNKLFKL